MYSITFQLQVEHCSLALRFPVDPLGYLEVCVVVGVGRRVGVWPGLCLVREGRNRIQEESGVSNKEGHPWDYNER